MSHVDRETCKKILLSSRECHYCHRVGHLKRSCRKYLKKVKEKQLQTEKRKEELDKCWKKLLTKSMDEMSLMIKSLQLTISSLKNKITKQSESIKQQNERKNSQPYITSDFFVDLISKSNQVLINKFVEIVNDQNSEQESSSSSEEEILMFGPRFMTTSTSKKKNKIAQIKKPSRQEEASSPKRKGKQNKRKN